MIITGGQAVVKSLELEGVKHIFGYPGGAVLPLYNSLRESSIKHILVRQEQSAAHSASGYSRATRKVGVCIATSGPGATNLVTGIATAYMDSIPIVAITGQVSSDMIGRDVFQEVDITGATAPFCKHNYLVKNVEDIPSIIKEAFYIAKTGRPGPVLIDLPKDVAEQTLEFKYPDSINLRGYKPTYKGHPLQIKKIIKALNDSKRPVICAGGGAISSNAFKEIKELSEIINCPVATTLMGIGSFSGKHTLSVGMLGQHGSYGANKAVSEADLLMILGARLGDRATGKLEEFATKATIIHIDVDAAEIGKNVNTHIPIVGDLKTILKEVLKGKLQKKDSIWVENIKSYEEKCKITKTCKTNKINPRYIFDVLSSVADKSSIIVTDVGQHQIFTGKYYPIEEAGAFITSGGLGTMGYGLPAAVGVSIANTGKNVILVTGDGSFQMTLNELATAAQEGVSIKILLFNNFALGMVRELQEHGCGGRYYEVHMKGNPDFIKLAEAYGFKGIRVENEDMIEAALRQAFESDKTFLVEFLVDPGANIIPVEQEVRA